jgi:competence protein ComEA
MKSWQLVAFGLMLGLLMTAVIVLIITRQAGQPIEILPAPTPSPLVVHVSGEVQTPGLYTLPAKSRVADAVEAAGGLLASADTAAINLAAWVNDGDKVWIPAVGDDKNGTQQSSAQNGTVIININKASARELETLPGIGEVKAEQIVAYRDEHGLYLNLDELLNVPGIGPELLEKIRSYITLSD